MITHDQKEEIVNKLIDIIVDYKQPPKNFKAALDAFFKPATDTLSARFNELEKSRQASAKRGRPAGNVYEHLAADIHTQGISFAGKLSNTFHFLNEALCDYEEVLNYVRQELDLWNDPSTAYSEVVCASSSKEFQEREKNRNAFRRYHFVNKPHGQKVCRYFHDGSGLERDKRRTRTEAIIATVPEWSFPGASTVKKLKDESDRRKSAYSSTAYCGVKYF